MYPVLGAGHHHGHHTLSSQLSHELDELDANADAFPERLDVELAHSGANGHALQTPHGSFEQGPHNPFEHAPRTTEITHPAPALPSAGHFGILTSGPSLTGHAHASPRTIGGQQPEQDLFSPTDGTVKLDGHIANLRIVPDPPDLDVWRQRLFDINDTITLSEEECVAHQAPH